jgi:hypothetical protein
VADEVEQALAALSCDDVWAVSGPSSDGVYVEPVEAGMQVVEEALAPFRDDVLRRLSLGNEVQAAAVCHGILAGLYRVATAPSADEYVWGYDEGAETAGWIIDEWQRWTRRGGRKKAPDRAVRVLDPDVVATHMPSWGWLESYT